MENGKIILENTEAVVELVESNIYKSDWNQFVNQYEITLSYNGKSESFEYNTGLSYESKFGKPIKEMLLQSVIEDYRMDMDECQDYFGYRAIEIYSEIERVFNKLLNIYSMEEIRAIEIALNNE